MKPGEKCDPSASDCPYCPQEEGVSPSAPLAVLLADHRPVPMQNMAKRLERMGHTLLATVSEGQTALAVARQLRPALVLASLSLPSLNGVELARAVATEKIAPVVLLLDPGDYDIPRRLAQSQACGCLPACASEAYLAGTIEVACNLFRERLGADQENQRLAERLKARQVVERAKGALMERHGYTEAEAYRWLQKQSQNTRKPLREVAEAVIVALF